MVTVPLQQTLNIEHHSIVPFSHDNKSALRPSSDVVPLP